MGQPKIVVKFPGEAHQLFNSRFLLFLLFYVVAQNDSHVCVSREVIRVDGSQIIAHRRIVVR